MLVPWRAALACADFAAAPSSRWSIGQLAAGPVLLTPCGEPFFSLGVNAVNGGGRIIASENPKAYQWKRFAGTRRQWVASTRDRLLEWNFNTAGAWSLPPAEIGLPSTPELDLARSIGLIWDDPFDPGVLPRLMEAAVQAVSPYRGDPRRIGYFSDNEIGWWNGSLFLVYMAAQPQSQTKQRLLALVREHYSESWAAFMRDFVPPEGVASFSDLLASRSPPHLRPGGRGIDVVRAWTRIFAARYYSLMSQALQAADPDALYLGDRLPIYYDPDAIRAMAPYVDVISVNYTVDASDGWVAPYFFTGLHDLTGGKPVMITEWFFAAAENRSGNLNRTGAPHRGVDAPVSNNRNVTGHLMTVATQTQRARGARLAARLLAGAPDVVGLHWFQYADEPRGGRGDGEDYDFGLVDVDDRPYEALTDALREANQRILARLGQKNSAPADAIQSEIALPHAEINKRSQSLAEWPKSASLLPLKPAPSEVDFGDVHLVWDERGLFLATISMDYYDPDLLDVEADFPRSEAFRIAIGGDAGAGAQRVELRVVPTSVVQTAKKEKKLRFAVETCRYDGETDRCRSVPGATTLYFGTALDQPRVILKGLVPWSALGLPGPPDARRLRLYVGVTAFYRSKWMSNNGLSPEFAMAHPESWMSLKLGGPPLSHSIMEQSTNRAVERPN